MLTVTCSFSGRPTREASDRSDLDLVAVAPHEVHQSLEDLDLRMTRLVRDLAVTEEGRPQTAAWAGKSDE